MAENISVAHSDDNASSDSTDNTVNTANTVPPVSYTELTREFYRAFSQKMPPAGTEASLDESVISEDRLHLKMNLIAEEFVELVEAAADLRVVLDGFDIEAAIPTEAVVEEVFRSNMSKLDSEGNPIISDGSGIAPLGKILKSDNYFPPNVEAILKNNRAQ